MAAKIMSDLPALMATVERNNVLATLLDVVTEYEPEVSSMLGGATNVERLHRVGRDFRTDTTTIPTDAMFLAGQQATRGDDVLEEDQSTIDLERRLAALSGKEAALFCVSGTMTNLAIRCHMARPPYSITLDGRSHVQKMEAGAAAVISQATSHQLYPKNGLHLTAEEVESHIYARTTPLSIHMAPTQLVCLENSTSGIIFPQAEIEKIAAVTNEHGLKLHLDGARIWNVVDAEMSNRQLSYSEEHVRAVLSGLLAPFDTASLCLSKGVGAPIGSVIVGPKKFINHARYIRKMMGGAVRQIGPMTAMADYALTYHLARLGRTHALAVKLARELQQVGCTILAPVDTSIVFFDPSPIGLHIMDVVEGLAALPDPILLSRERCILHHQTSPAAVDDFVACVAQLAKDKTEGRLKDIPRPTRKGQIVGY